MPFDSGSFTVSIFELPQPLPPEAIEMFAAKKAGTLDSVKDEPQIGWVTGRHLLETDINESNAWCGSCLYLALRKAQRKIPGSLLNAIAAREELVYMLAHETAFVPRSEKKKIKAEAAEKLLMKMPPSISGVPMVYDPAAQLLYIASASPTQLDEFLGVFVKTTGIEPLPWNIESMLNKLFQVPESSLPAIRLTEKAENGEAVPGRDFLTWLWYYSEAGAGGIEHPQYGGFDMLIEAPFTFVLEDSAAHGAAETTIKKGDCPSRSAEVKAALSVGKKLKKAKFTLAREDQFWTGTFDADHFAFGGMKLPEGDEMGRDEAFAERMQNLLIFKEVLESYFKIYGETLLAMNLPDEMAKLQRWVQDRDSL